MRAIMISDKPKWCALMMNGIKKIEVRKGTALYKAIQKLINEYGYADIYVYCTKDNKDYLYYDEDFGDYITLSQNFGELNGKVVFKFRCYKVEEINAVDDSNPSENEYDYYYSTPTCGSEGDLLVDFGDKQSLTELSCLDELELDDYLRHKASTAIHISELEIFDEPRELSEFSRYSKCKKQNQETRCLVCYALSTKSGLYCLKSLTKAPQSWCYVEVLE